jgi:hypothetical protein
MSDVPAADAEQELRVDQMRADIQLKNRQESLELPKFVVASIIGAAAVAGAIGTWFGWSLRGAGHG